MINHSELKDKVDKKRSDFKKTLRRIMESEFLPYFLNHRELNVELERAVLNEDKAVQVYLTNRTPAILVSWISIPIMIKETCFKVGYFKDKQVKFKDINLNEFLDELPSVDHSESFIEEILRESSIFADMEKTLKDKGYRASLERKTIQSRLATCTVPCITIYLSEDL